MTITYRLLTLDDVAAYRAVADRAFEDLGARRGPTPAPWTTPPDHIQQQRFTRLLESDSDGCWAAIDGGGRLVGGAIALLRDDVWGLSSLVVDPSVQSRGVGRALLERALRYGDGGRRGAIILASSDARAMRAYARAGFHLRPSNKWYGRVRPDRRPDGVEIREAGPDELPATARASRHVRGASHHEDIGFWFGDPATRLFVAAGERGFAVLRAETVALLAAVDAAAAQALLWAALSAVPPDADARVDWITSEQAWALPVVLDAGLLPLPEGAVMTRGQPGTWAPFLPNGAFL